jgi:hypothetical protein
MRKDQKGFLETSKSEIANFTITVIGLVSICVAFFQVVRGQNKSESIDKAIVLASILILLTVFFSRLTKPAKAKPSIILPIIAILSLFVGIIGIEKHDAINGVDLAPILWLGYGPWVALLTLALIPFVSRIYTWDRLNKPAKYFFRITASLVTVFSIPAIWQGGNSIIDNYSSEYVLNEALSVSAGNYPYVDFIPQYGTLYAWVLAPFKGLLNADQLVTFALYLMSAATVLAIFLAVIIVHRVMSRRSLSLAVLLVIPFTVLAQFPNRKVYSGTIFSQLPAIPTRIVPGVVVGLLVLLSYRAITEKKMKRLLNLASVLVGANLWNSVDFGIALFLSMVVVTFFIRKDHGLKNSMHAIAWAILGFVIYPSLMLSTGHKVQWSWYGTFVKQFGGGFGSEPIITPGPVLIILPLIVGLVGASYFVLFREKFLGATLQDEQRQALVISSLFSTWCLLGFAYYLNRSYASGQMQILFLPLAVASAAFFAFLNPRDGSSNMWNGKSIFSMSTWKKSSFAHNSGNILLSLVMALPLATTLAFPNPAIEFDRLTSAPPENLWPKPTNVVAFSKLSESKAGFAANAGYFGTSSNYVQLKYGIKSGMLFNSPFDLTLGLPMVLLECDYLKKQNFAFLFANNEGLAIADAFQDKKVCGMYGITPETNTSRILAP